jgi:hypothetical protein
MVAWLDQYIIEELVRSYVAAAEAGRFEAFHYLNRFRQRIQYNQQINTLSRIDALTARADVLCNQICYVFQSVVT